MCDAGVRIQSLRPSSYTRTGEPSAARAASPRAPRRRTRPLCALAGALQAGLPRTRTRGSAPARAATARRADGGRVRAPALGVGPRTGRGAASSTGHRHPFHRPPPLMIPHPLPSRSNNALGDAGVAALSASLARLGRLEHLDLGCGTPPLRHVPDTAPLRSRTKRSFV